MTETMTDGVKPWRGIEKFAFRFSFTFILTFVLVNNNGAFPFFSIVLAPVKKLLHQFVPWFAQHILHYHYDYKIFSNGSGDTSYDWISVLLFILLAFLSAIVWSLFDRKRKSYNTCFYWLTVAIRYYLAFMLINYGVIKMMHAQMPPPTLNRLMEPLSEFSPMGLAWTYFGFSKEYSFFVGFVEVLSGFLLFRKTMVFGALITVATTLNVVAVNYFFDVPVKLLSSSLLLFSLYLLLPYLRPLYTLFFRGGAVKLEQVQRPTYKTKWKGTSLAVIKIALLGSFIVLQIILSIQRNKMIKDYFKTSPLYGIYHIDHSQSKRETIPLAWRSLIFEFGETVTIRDDYYQASRKQIALDTKKQTISLNNFTFNYKRLENGDITLTKEWENEIETILLKKLKPEQFNLLRGEFRWIQEYPYNR